MEADVTRAAALVGLALAELEATLDARRHLLDDGTRERLDRTTDTVRTYFDALRTRMREEEDARDEAWTLVSHQATRLLHPALDSQTVNEVGATISRVADAMLADEPLPDDLAALLPSEPEQDGDLMHRDGTPVMKVQPSLDAMGGPLDVDEDEEDEPVPVYPTEKPQPGENLADYVPPDPPRFCHTLWAREGSPHIHSCSRRLNHDGPHTCSTCDATFRL